MRSIKLAIAFLFLFASVSASAQTCSGRTCVGNITATNASCITTACVALNLPTGSGATSLTVSGTFVATLAFEAAGDGVNFAPVNCYPSNSTTAATSATAVGTWQCSVAGYSEIRVRASAYTSGTAKVSLNSSSVALLFARMGGSALAFSPVDVLITANGSAPGTTVTTLNMASASTTEGTANYTSYDAVATGMTFAASCVNLPASVTVNGGATHPAGFAGQSLALIGTNTFTTTNMSFTGIPVNQVVVISGFICNTPPVNLPSGQFYDLVLGVGTITPISAVLQLNDGTGASCGAYGYEVEKSGGTTTHSPCNSGPAAGSNLYFSMLVNWSNTGTCNGTAAPCAALNLYQSDAKTQIGSTVSLAIASDQLGHVNFGNNQGSSTAQTYNFQWLMVDYTNHVWPNVAH